MTMALGVVELCYNCRRIAIAICDFRRTALDKCGRPVCVDHCRLVFDGREHLCEDHADLMNALGKRGNDAKNDRSGADSDGPAGGDVGMGAIETSRHAD